MKVADSQPKFPKMLGQYRLLDIIGKGGMGEIFLAEDPVFQRHVALKKILPKLISYRSIKKRFLNEAKIAARLCPPFYYSYLRSSYSRRPNLLHHALHQGRNT